MASIEINTRKIIQRLEAEGWQNIGGGKHDKFERLDRADIVILPRHKQQSLGVARSIAKLVGWI